MYYPKPPSSENQFLNAHANLLASNFQKLLNYPLLKTNAKSFAEQLFYAPFVVLSHNANKEPIFNYANQQGLDLFELEWANLIRLPSRYSAERVHQSEREKLIAQVTKKGFIDDYEGIRISSTGKRFNIKKAIIWNLYDENSAYCGQAACFSEWHFLDSLPPTNKL